jgi:DNA polymerase III delta prime subunit
VHLNVINRDSVRAVLEGEKNGPSSDLEARSSRTSAWNVKFSEALSYKPEYSPIQMLQSTDNRSLLKEERNILNQSIQAEIYKINEKKVENFLLHKTCAC